MGARLFQARGDHRIEGRALVLYGDELNDVDVNKLVEAHEARGALLTFTGYNYTLPFGTVRGGQIGIDESLLINIGYAIVEPSCWQWGSAEDGFAEMVNRVSEATGRTFCYVHEGKRATINNLRDLSAAESQW